MKPKASLGHIRRTVTDCSAGIRSHDCSIRVSCRSTSVDIFDRIHLFMAEQKQWQPLFEGF